ncbi:hypothetical protein Ciccas_008220 [Cichlidogyrus casuarinus]|uniref:Uncharacterized protein n=1 Tax=Cichlidogyrus casuarinus TaxID=1844966 RepID=A0ABD2Q0W9_9PLAT
MWFFEKLIQNGYLKNWIEYAQVMDWELFRLLSNSVEWQKIRELPADEHHGKLAKLDECSHEPEQLALQQMIDFVSEPDIFSPAAVIGLMSKIKSKEQVDPLKNLLHMPWDIMELISEQLNPFMRTGRIPLKYLTIQRTRHNYGGRKQLTPKLDETKDKGHNRI